MFKKAYIKLKTNHSGNNHVGLMRFILSKWILLDVIFEYYLFNFNVIISDSMNKTIAVSVIFSTGTFHHILVWL